MLEVPCRDGVPGGVECLVAPLVGGRELGQAVEETEAVGPYGDGWYPNPQATAKSFVPKWEAVT